MLKDGEPELLLDFIGGSSSSCRLYTKHQIDPISVGACIASGFFRCALCRANILSLFAIIK